MTVQLQVSLERIEGADAFIERLASRTGTLGPVLDDIGGGLKASTKRRFLDEQDPEGNKWQGHSDATIAERGEGADILRKDQHLWDTIDYQVQGDHVSVGANRIYARIHQLGGQAGRKTARVEIPARPYLGISKADEAMIVETITEHLERAR